MLRNVCERYAKGILDNPHKHFTIHLPLQYPLVIKPLLDSIEQISVQFEQLISTAAKIDDKQQAVIEVSKAMEIMMLSS